MRRIFSTISNFYTYIRRIYVYDIYTYNTDLTILKIERDVIAPDLKSPRYLALLIQRIGRVMRAARKKYSCRSRMENRDK
jgi:hypothetical protein